MRGYLFGGDQPGALYAINLATGAMSQFLNASSLLAGLVPLNGLGARELWQFDERGLLGIAFCPRYAANGRLYTSEAASGPADLPIVTDLTPAVQQQFDALGLTYPNHQSVIREWVANNPGDPSAGVGANSRVVLRVDHAQFNHDAGAIVFDNDGMLLIALGVMAASMIRRRTIGWRLWACLEVILCVMSLRHIDEVKTSYV